MKNTVEQIIRQYGSQILLDESRFAAIVDDLSPKEAEIERKVIRRMAQSHLLRDIYNVYWDEQFKEYIKRYSEPMEWLYILLKPSGDTLCWNRLYYDNLVGDGMLDYYAQDFLGLDLSKELKDDLAQVSGRNNEASFTATNFGQHPFLVAAKKWWDEKDIINS